ncbi:MAG TPA: hypothetical protein VHR45_19225 [Thermoanaerobaculia bacterium]|nr:hypothetical protein [Thermoanaerobaculia bacterium]
MKEMKSLASLASLALLAGVVLAAAFAAPAASAQAPAGSTPPAGTASPAAGAAPPTELPKPSPALDQLKFFAGTWSCTGTAWVNGKEHKTTAKVTMGWDLNGFFMNLRYQERKTAANPMPLTAVEHWGYSDELKQLVAGQVDSMGGYGTQATAGWEGETMVWTGQTHVMGMKAPTRDTFVKKGDSGVTHLGEIQTDGTWVKQDEETCKRAAKK